MTSGETSVPSDLCPTLSPGDLLDGRYRIVKKLAEGSMGAVYEAISLPLERRVAIKVLRPDRQDDPTYHARFRREARALSQLHHPNTISILDIGQGDMPYMVMEYVEGEPLSDLLGRVGSLPLERALDVVVQIGMALAEAHDKGIVHRDLKPENVFLLDVGGDYIKILDFGIAALCAAQAERITKNGFVCGTPEYMSPEQARGDSLDGRSDLYALAVMLWEMIEGRLPFDEESPLKTILAHQHNEAPAMTADVPQALQEFLARAMAKDRNARPDDATQFLDELEAAVASPVVNDTDSAPMRRRARRRRSLAARAAAVAVGVASVALGIVVF